MMMVVLVIKFRKCLHATKFLELLFSLDFHFVNEFKRNTHTQKKQNFKFPFHIRNSKRFQFSPYRRVQNRYYQ
jgi:hypothetical protein